MSVQSNYLDDSMALSNYRAIAARLAAAKAGEYGCLSFADFLEDPVVVEHDTGYVDVRFVAVYHDSADGSIYEVSSLVWLSPVGRVTVIDYSAALFNRSAQEDDSLFQHLPFGGEEV